MTEFKDKERGVRFTLPDKINVRDQLRYFDALAVGKGVSDLERYWLAAVSIMQDWECEKLPELDVDLGELHDLDVTGLVIWTGTTVLNHMNRAEGTPKN